MIENQIESIQKHIDELYELYMKEIWDEEYNDEEYNDILIKSIIKSITNLLAYKLELEWRLEMKEIQKKIDKYVISDYSNEEINEDTLNAIVDELVNYIHGLERDLKYYENEDIIKLNQCEDDEEDIYE